MAAPVDDSGAGTSILIYGDARGLRLRQVGADAGEPIAEPYLLLADDAIVGLAPDQRHGNPAELRGGDQQGSDSPARRFFSIPSPRPTDLRLRPYWAAINENPARVFRVEEVSPWKSSRSTESISAYEVRGDGPPLLLLHGFFGSSGDWVHLFDVDALSKRWRLIMPDARGHGRSTNPSGLVTHRQAADDIRALLEHLAVDRFKAVGVSFGGNILLHLASRPTRERARGDGHHRRPQLFPGAGASDHVHLHRREPHRRRLARDARTPPPGGRADPRALASRPRLLGPDRRPGLHAAPAGDHPGAHVDRDRRSRSALSARHLRGAVPRPSRTPRST